MDVTFTNVLEGARQYFQGLPTATSSAVGPTSYSTSSDNLLRSNTTDHELPPSSTAYWSTQQEMARPPTREQTPVQRPPSHHSDTSRPPSISQVGEPARSSNQNHYQGTTYQEQIHPQQQQHFQFSRPHSRDVAAPTSQQQQYQQYHQPPSPQQPRTSRPESMISPVSTSQTYHQLQNSIHTSGYPSYQHGQQSLPQQHQQQQQQQQHSQQQHQQQQQQQASRSYYTPQQASKPPTPTSNQNYKLPTSQSNNNPATSQENPYYKHLYTPHSQSSSQYTKPSYSQEMKPQDQQQQQQQQQHIGHSNQVSQGYRTTHNLPPIAALSSISYHSNRNHRETVRSTLKSSTAIITSTTSTTTNAQHVAKQQQQQPPQQQQQQQYYVPRTTEQYGYRGQYSVVASQSNRLPVTQNYYGSTTTTQSYSHVIMTTSSTSTTYSIPIQNQSSSSSITQHYYQSSKVHHDSSSHQNNRTVPPQQQQQQQHQPASLKQKRESPLDLSVKTVRTPADSTLEDLEQDSRKYYNMTAISRQNQQPVISSHNYPTYDVYANSVQRNIPAALPPRSTQSSATAPKIEFHPNFNVAPLNHPSNNLYKRSNSCSTNSNNNVQSLSEKANNQRVPYNKTSSSSSTTSTSSLPYPNQNSVINRYSTASIPSAAHVNSHIQSSAPPKRVEGLPRIDFPPPGHGHKTSALYPMPSHDVQKKRAADTPPTNIIPNKLSKVDAWRQSIDQQIEQRFFSYQQQVQQQQQKSTGLPTKSSVVNGSYPGLTQDKSKDMYNSYHRQQYQLPSQHQAYANTQYPLQNSHNQTYVPSAVAHQFPGYSNSQQYHSNITRTNSNSSLPTTGVSNPSKAPLGGADKRVLSLLRNSLEIKGAKKLEQEQMNRSYENKRIDVQHPSTDVTAPLQPKPGFNSRQNVSPFTPTNLPEGNNAMTSIYKLHIPKAIDSVNFESESNRIGNTDKFDETQSVISHTNPNGDLDGLAAFLAARIRTKAELKQVGPGTQNIFSNTANSHLHNVIEKQLKTPSKQDNYFMNSSSSSNPTTGSPPKLSKERLPNPPRRRLFSRTEEDSLNNSGVPPRDKSGLRSSSETSVFDFPDSDSETEMPVLERQTLEDMRRNRTKPDIMKAESPRPPSPGDDLFTQACDSFMEQLKNGSGKKRGRRKKLEAEVLAKLETVTKEKPLDGDIVIKKEIEEDLPKPEEKPIKVEMDEMVEEKDTNLPPPNNNINNSIDVDNNSSDKCKKETTEISLKDISKVITRPAKKPLFGDGSHFSPGWEEEVYKYKKSLRMPPSLIQVTRPPHYHRLSTSLPDLDPCPQSPTPSSIDPSEIKTKSKIKSEEVIDSDNESNCSINIFSNKNNYDSEGSSSIKSLPNTTKENNSILDTLLERYGGKRKRKTKRKDDNNRPKIIPKPEKVIELLPTPTKTEKESKTVKTDAALLGFRKQTIDNFKDVFSEKHRIRKQKRAKEQVTIREVFGEDRPASAPPVTCVNHIKIKEEVLDNETTNDKPDDDNSSDTKQALKNKLLNRGRKDNLLKSLVERKIKTEFQNQDDEDIDDEDDDDIKQEQECKSGTPSIDGDEGSISGRKKNRNIRRKFSSGFDYIRKKKKQSKKDNLENETIIKPKRRGIITLKTNPGSVQDIQKEIKGWVLNKGIGETHLHRSARLGYTDITAYCLEKMECSPSPKDNAGYTPLHEASARGHLGIAKMLLMYGANVSESARGGIRPLHEAVENGYVEIVRLLLSYGADPMLATYSGMTPLALAAEETTAKLLQNHINALEGKPTPTWYFPGPASCFDLKETGYDILADVPEDDPLSEVEDIDFEVSDTILPNLYTLRGEAHTDRWILLQDLSNLLKIKSRDALLKQICPTPTTSSPGSSSSTQINYKSVLRELKMSDFLEQAHCCQFLNAGEKINTRASKIALVKYTDKVKELLNVEKINISIR